MRDKLIVDLMMAEQAFKKTCDDYDMASDLERTAADARKRASGQLQEAKNALYEYIRVEATS